MGVFAQPYAQPSMRPPDGFDHIVVGERWPGGPIQIWAASGEWVYSETYDRYDWDDRQERILTGFRVSAMQSLKDKHA